MREELGQLGQAPNPDALAVLELTCEAFLAWCPHPKHGLEAASSAATFAKRFGEMVLVNENDPRRALAMLERAWQYRDDAGYRVCELALTLADAYRIDQNYAGTQRALDYYASLAGTPAWQKWQKSELKWALVQIHDLQYQCRRAMLELFLGNPDAVLDHLHLAARMRAAPRHTPPAIWADHVAAMWVDAEFAFYRDQVDCYFGTESFAAAVRAAKRARKRLHDLKLDDTLFQFYLALAQSWDQNSTDAELVDAKRTVQTFADGPYPVLQNHALRRLLEWSTLRKEPDEAAAYLHRLQRLNGSLAPRETSLQTELLLLQDQRKPCTGKELRAQKQAQQAAFDELQASWRRTPPRSGGIGFLHYLDRREAIGQLVAITLRAAAPTREAPPEAAIKEALQYVMAAQTHGALAKLLKAGVPNVNQLQSLLGAKQGVVLFLPTRSQTHVFALTNKQVSYHPVQQGALKIRNDIQLFLDVLKQVTNRLDHSESEATELATKLKTIGARLSKVLVPDALRTELATWDKLTIIGSELLHGPVSGSADAGYLNYLPIECLPWNDEQLFGQHFAIDHNASLPVWKAMAERAAPTGRLSHLRLFGVLNESGTRSADGSTPAIAKADRLPSEWVEQVGAAFKQRDPHFDEACLLEKVTPPKRQGKRTAAAERTASDSSIAMFLAHGGYDGSDERGSYLQLYGDRLDCPAAQRLGSPDAPFADIVLLAACRAAKGPNRAGDSPANLGGAFLLAGATAVMQSRFDLSLRRTQSLLSEVLEQLAKGATSAGAMRTVRAAAPADDALDAYRTGVLQVHGYGQAPVRR